VLILGKVTARMTKLSTTWQSAKVVRTREKASFFFSVMCLTFTAMLYGMAPEYVVLSLYVLLFISGVDGFP
jgi:hypothetical protein